jgi:hypothetical protein
VSIQLPNARKKYQVTGVQTIHEREDA